jgi:hypothetical protein
VDECSGQTGKEEEEDLKYKDDEEEKLIADKKEEESNKKKEVVMVNLAPQPASAFEKSLKKRVSSPLKASIQHTFSVTDYKYRCY